MLQITLWVFEVLFSAQGKLFFIWAWLMHDRASAWRPGTVLTYQKSGFLFGTQYISWLLYLYYVLGLRTLRLKQDPVFLDGVYLPQSNEKMDLFQGHSALGNIKYILSLDWWNVLHPRNQFFWATATSCLRSSAKKKNHHVHINLPHSWPTLHVCS